MSNDLRPILLIDAMNLFVRCYSAYPTMSTLGHQMGGAVGFLKTLSRLVDQIQPRAIYIAWEGGGSTKRRKIFSEYKLNRKPGRLNRFYGDDIPDSESNRKDQILSLLGYLKCIPVCQIYASDCEGDDVIAYLCRGPFKNDDKIIASSDKDMYQLLDDKTKQYSLHKKTFVTKETVLEDFRITANNFAIAKAICGDVGDNVPGVKGVGWKTVIKLFPVLGTEEDVMLQTIFDHCAAHKSESGYYQRILDNESEVKRNWKLVYLDGSMLAANQAEKVDYALETFVPVNNKLGLARLLLKDGIGDFDYEYFFCSFFCIENMKHETGE